MQLIVDLPPVLLPIFSEQGVLLSATFGVLAVLIVLCTLFFKIRFIMLHVALPLAVTWPFGFIVAIAGHFSQIAPIKLALMWLVIFTGFFLFTLFKRKQVKIFMNWIEKSGNEISNSKG